jgi:hypothetical protein
MLWGGTYPPFYSTFRRARCAPEPTPRPITRIPLPTIEHTICFFGHFHKPYHAAIWSAPEPAVLVGPMDPTINPSALPTVSPDNVGRQRPSCPSGPHLLPTRE